MSGTKRRSAGRAKLKAAAGWGLIGIIGLVFYALGYGITAILVSVGSGVVAGVLAAFDLKENGAMLDRPRVVATTKKERPAAKTLTRGQARRLIGSIGYRSQEAVEHGQVRTGTFRVGGRRRTCNESCKKSRLPRKFCKCPCGGAHHGSTRSLVPVSTARVSQRLSTPPPRPPARPNPSRSAKSRKGVQRPQAKPATVPDGDLGDQVTVVWRNYDGDVFRVTTSRATAKQMQAQGRLIKFEGKVRSDA
jgi:hypothetical protein